MCSAGNVKREWERLKVHLDALQSALADTRELTMIFKEMDELMKEMVLLEVGNTVMYSLHSSITGKLLVDILNNCMSCIVRPVQFFPATFETGKVREFEIRLGFMKLGQVNHGKMRGEPDPKDPNPDFSNLKWSFEP